MTGADENSLLLSLFFAYPDALLVVDAGGRIVRANPAAARLLGYTADELTDLDVDTLVPQAIRGRHADYRRGYAQAPRPRPHQGPVRYCWPNTATRS